jgi:predicted transposase YbfD/YdcC
MDAQATAPFLRFFTDLKDPRRHNVRHMFTDILTIAILGVLCRSNDWEEIVLWAQAEIGWLGTILALPNGIPSADTFARVFARINPRAFEACFVNWAAAVAGSLKGQVVAIDGKALRHSFEHAWDKQMIHLVSAFAAGRQLVLGQLAVDDKSNEITAIPRLLALLDVKGATVTIDAMGCQREIAADILAGKADYVLAVKENQPALHDKVTRLLDEARLERFAGMSHGYFEQTNGGHGRIETRKVWVTDEVKWLGDDLRKLWPGLASVAMVESTRVVAGGASSSSSLERHYFISSRTGTDASAMAGAIRAHWGVENRLHWHLDVSFGEDASRLRKDHGAENFSRLRRMTLNLLKTAPGSKRHSIKNKRFRCSIDRPYLLTVLSQ